MAEGGGGGLDSLKNDLEKALPSLTPKQRKPVKRKPVKRILLRVISWNINGMNGGGRSKCRQALVPAMLKELNADAVLLQEIPIKGFKEIITECTRKRNYDLVISERLRSEHNGSYWEAGVVYDRQVFNYELESQAIMEQQLSAAIDEAVTKFKMKDIWKTILNNRVAAVKLKHIAMGTELVFLSFHSIQNNQTTQTKQLAANMFCDLANKLGNLYSTVVVAGADLNTSIHNRKDVLVPDYKLTKHRRQKVDYIILSQPPTTMNVQAKVTAEDIFPEDDSDHVHPYYSTVYEQLRRDCPNITLADYKSSLDHDPLVLDVKLIQSDDPNTIFFFNQFQYDSKICDYFLDLLCYDSKVFDDFLDMLQTNSDLVKDFLDLLQSKVDENDPYHFFLRLLQRDLNHLCDFFLHLLQRDSDLLDFFLQQLESDSNLCKDFLHIVQRNSDLLDFFLHLLKFVSINRRLPFIRRLGFIRRDDD